MNENSPQWLKKWIDDTDYNDIRTNKPIKTDQSFYFCLLAMDLKGKLNELFVLMYRAFNDALGLPLAVKGKITVFGFPLTVHFEFPYFFCLGLFILELMK